MNSPIVASSDDNTTLSCQDIVKSIRQIKAVWRASTGTEESRRLQLQIAEKKRLDRLEQVNAGKLMSKFAQECSRFYKAAYKEERQRVAQHTAEVYEKNVELWENLSQVREEESQEHNELLRSLAADAKERIRKVKDARKEGYQRDMRQHLATISVLRESIEARKAEQEKNHREELQIKKEFEKSEARNRALLAEERQYEMRKLLLYDEEILEEKRKQIEERHQLRNHLEALDHHKRKGNVNAMKVARQWEKTLEEFFTREVRTRTHLARAEADARRELSIQWRAAVSEFVQQIRGLYRGKIEEHIRIANQSQRAQSALQCQTRSQKRLEESKQKRELAEQRLHQLHEVAVRDRTQRLLQLRETIREEAQLANNQRCRTLMKMKGEKLVTESAPFQIAKGLSKMEETLPPELQRNVVELIRAEHIDL